MYLKQKMCHGGRVTLEKLWQVPKKYGFGYFWQKKWPRWLKHPPRGLVSKLVSIPQKVKAIYHWGKVDDSESDLKVLLDRQLKNDLSQKPSCNGKVVFKSGHSILRLTAKGVRKYFLRKWKIHFQTSSFQIWKFFQIWKLLVIRRQKW